MQFKVPQFLEIEDKIFGPFTFRQFVYLVGGGGMCFVIYKLLGLIWGTVPIIFIGGLTLALTFWKPNDKPFINMLESAIRYFLQDKLYIWQRRKVKKIQEERAKAEELKMEAVEKVGLKLSGNKLRDLAWSLDVLDTKKK